MIQQRILLAGATGDLGARIAKALVASGASVRALVRAGVSDADRDRLTAMGAAVVPADVSDTGSVAAACEGTAPALRGMG